MSVGYSDANLLLVGTAATYAMVMLSLVLLTGYGGHVSLAQFTFAGVGALAYAKLDQPNLYGLLVAALIAAAVGALVALPVLRLTGLYLALSTLAFGLLMDKMVFQSVVRVRLQRHAAGRAALAARDLGRLHRRLRAGDVRVLRADGAGAARAARRRARPAADRDARQPGRLRHPRPGHALVPGRRCSALTAGMAGLAGALFAGLRGTIGATDFQLLASLPLLLLAVVFGVTSVTGAALGGIGLMLLPVLQSYRPELAGLMFAVLGFGAVALGRDPNGLANLLFGLGRRELAPQLRARAARPAHPAPRRPRTSRRTTSREGGARPCRFLRSTTSSSSSVA